MLESRIEAIRKKLSYVHVLIECNKKQKYTKQQKNIKYKMEKQYGKVTTEKLMSLNARLRQELKVDSLNLKKREKIEKRRYINRMFRISLKKVHRSMKGEKSEPVKIMPPKEETQSFWSSIAMWGKEVKHRQGASRIQVLRNEYCVEAQQEQYVITDDIFDEVLHRLANDKPGRDQAAGIWIKHLNSTRETFKGHLKEMLSRKKEPPRLATDIYDTTTSQK